MHLPVEIKILHPEASVPQRATEMSAAVDLRIYYDEPGELTLAPGEQSLQRTGIAINIGDPGWCAMILPRSGLGVKGTVLGNLVGLIDADYQGELKVCLWNRGTDTVTLNSGDRVAQLLFVPVGIPEFTEVGEFAPSVRGEGGFGHSGIN